MNKGNLKLSLFALFVPLRVVVVITHLLNETISNGELRWILPITTWLA